MTSDFDPRGRLIAAALPACIFLAALAAITLIHLNVLNIRQIIIPSTAPTIAGLPQ